MCSPIGCVLLVPVKVLFKYASLFGCAVLYNQPFLVAHKGCCDAPDAGVSAQHTAFLPAAPLLCLFCWHACSQSCLQARLLGAGSSFKLKPLSAYYKQHRQASSARASLSAEPQGVEPSALQANSAGAAAQHTGIGPSKLRHASSSPELAGMQQGQPASSSKPARSKLGGSASFPPTAGGATGGGVDLGQGGGQPVQGSAVSPEPKQGCAASLASLLTHKLSHVKSSSSSSGGGQHQLSQLHLEQQHAEQALQSAATATEPTRQQQQQEQQRSCSPVSTCGDSTSELVHAGNCQELCVGRQGQRVQAEALTLEDELAALTGQQAATQQGPARQYGSGGRIALGGRPGGEPLSVGA